MSTTVLSTSSYRRELYHIPHVAFDAGQQRNFHRGNKVSYSYHGSLDTPVKVDFQPDRVSLGKGPQGQARLGRLFSELIRSLALIRWLRRTSNVPPSIRLLLPTQIYLSAVAAKPESLMHPPWCSLPSMCFSCAKGT